MTFRYMFRSATGEAWQAIMIDCVSAECDPIAEAGNAVEGEKNCGNVISYMYFTSFIFFCSFLVRIQNLSPFFCFLFMVVLPLVFFIVFFLSIIPIESNHKFENITNL